MIVITYEFTEITKRHPAGTLTCEKKWVKTTPRNIFNAIVFIANNINIVLGRFTNTRIIVDGVALTDEQVANCPDVGYSSNLGWDRPAATYCRKLLAGIEDSDGAFRAEADRIAQALAAGYQALIWPLVVRPTRR
jgi:hypothetical protein